MLALAACGHAPATSGPRDVAVVVDHVDGDTLDVRVANGRVERVRLLGIDTPESVAPEQPVECHGPEASALLATLVPVGTEVRLERDIEARDRFGRLLAYVFRVDDGSFVNLALVRAGEAEELTIEPNTAYRDQLATGVADARRTGAGLWGDC